MKYISGHKTRHYLFLCTILFLTLQLVKVPLSSSPLSLPVVVLDKDINRVQKCKDESNQLQYILKGSKKEKNWEVTSTKNFPNMTRDLDGK